MFSFVEKEFPEMFEMWNSLEPFIKKVDSVRYMWLYKYGGVYSDFDVEWKKSPENLFKYGQNVYIPVSNISGNVRGTDASPAIMAGGKGNVIWLLILRYVCKNGEKNVMKATGPGALVRVLNAIKKLDLDISFLDEGRMGLGGLKNVLSTYAYHRNDGQWLDDRNSFLFKNERAISWLDDEILKKIDKEKYEMFLSRI